MTRWTPEVEALGWAIRKALRLDQIIEWMSRHTRLSVLMVAVYVATIIWLTWPSS